MNARFSLGIDLGTSNSAIAVANLESGETRIIKIAQVLGPNQLGEMSTLPSAIYIPHQEEFPEGSFPLPWNDAGERVITASSPGTDVRSCLIVSSPPPNPGCPTRTSTRSSEPYLGDPISRKTSSRLSNARAVTSCISGKRSCTPSGRRLWIGTSPQAKSL